MLYVFASVTTYSIGKWFSSEEKGTFSKLPPENVMKCCGINLYATLRLFIRKLPMSFWGAVELQYKKNSHHHNEFLVFQVNPQLTQFSLNFFQFILKFLTFSRIYQFFSFFSELSQFFLDFVSVFPQFWQIFLIIFYILTQSEFTSNTAVYSSEVFVKWTLFGFSKHCKWQLRRAIK